MRWRKTSSSVGPTTGRGGGAGAMARAVIHRADGGEEVVPSKLVTTLRACDRVVMETAGGGGYGDPAARDPAKLRTDVEDGKVSEAGAKAYLTAPHTAKSPA